MVVLNPDSIITGPSRSPRWGQALTIDLGGLDSTLAISRENRLPRAAVVVTLAAQELMRLSKAGEKVENILVVGSEVDPTMHPGFREISENLRSLRDKWFPRAKLNLLTDFSVVDDAEVRVAMGFYNNPVVRLEYGTVKTFKALTGRKTSHLGEIVHQLASLERVIVQANFVRGSVDNSTDSEVRGWIKRLRDVRPEEVQITSPPPRARKGQPQGISKQRMQEIVEQVTEEVGATVILLDPEDRVA
ncbi:MAG: hypothetical protein H6828_02825 [Planctomycetes bacterium]|nr:hypothetical protein [Planctomycetota bacterium]